MSLTLANIRADTCQFENSVGRFDIGINARVILPLPARSKFVSGSQAQGVIAKTFDRNAVVDSIIIEEPDTSGFIDALWKG